MSENRKWILLLTVMCTMAALLYFTRLNYFSCFVDDEFQSAAIARNFAQGRGFLKNDGTEYRRAWPATILLAGWIRVFGPSEIACRSLSALYGVLFIASVVYITWKMYASIGYSLVVCSFLLAEPTLTYYFRFTRMYSLAVLLSVWLYFFLYRVITERGARSIIYILATGIIGYLAYETHVNSVVPVVGAALFVILEAVIRKEKKNRYPAILISALGLAATANILYIKARHHFLFDYLGVFDKLRDMGSLFGNIRKEYFMYLIGTPYVWVVSAVCAVILFISLVYTRKFERKEWYLFLLSAWTVFFFVFLTDRYYASKYILMAVPLYIAFISIAWLKLSSLSPKAGKVSLYAVLLVGAVLWGRAFFKYTFTDNPKDMNYRMAFSRISEWYDVESETVPIIADKLRQSYLGQYVPNYENVPFDRATDMDIWLSFAKDHPDGIACVELIKSKKLKQGALTVMTDWTDQLSGPGVDDSNVYVSHYLFLMPYRKSSVINPGSSVVTCKAGDEYADFTVDCDKLATLLDTGGVRSTSDSALFCRLQFSTRSGEIIRRRIAFIIPPESEGILEYRAEASLWRNIDLSGVMDVKADRDMLLYSDGENHTLEGN